MISQLDAKLARLSGRERGLSAILLLGVVPFALVFWVAQPLVKSRDTAAAQFELAQSEFQWVNARHTEWQAATQLGGIAINARTSVGLSGVEAALSSAGLRPLLTTLENDQGGRVSLRLSTVPFVEAGRFMERLGPELGYEIGSLRIVATATAGLVDVALELIPIP